ncbi:MAG: PQQ-binding-like beta-propeller repeat protein, partial [Planctomycetes bacterium]|nr:PQQ-binding-like beta-propeller repeat protein [Planctomycetota bacterium]
MVPGLILVAALAGAIRAGEVRPFDAARALDRLEERSGRTPSTLRRRAEILLLAGRRDDAQRILDELAARRDAPGDAEGLARDLRREEPIPPPSLPRNLGLEARWDALAARGLGSDPRAIDGLLAECAGGEGLVPAADSLHTSVWTALDRALAGHSPERLAPLRDLQRSEQGPPPDPAESFARFRRVPRAPQILPALLALAESWLERGHAGLASRTFEDVLARASDPEIRRAAQVGCWLALAASDPDPTEIDAAFAGVEGGALFPWLGGRATAATIRDRLRESATASRRNEPVPPLAARTRRSVKLPLVLPRAVPFYRRVPSHVASTFPDPPLEIVAGDRIAIGSAPRLIAAFGPDPSTPLWWRTLPPDADPRREDDDGEETLVAPGPFRPAIGCGMVIARWGSHPRDRAPTDCIGIDAERGEVLWSAAGDPAWNEMAPLSDPALSDGRAVLLALGRSAQPISPVVLVCLDARSGSILWKTVLASQSVGLARASGSPGPAPDRVDLARFGAAVAIHRGSVYCATALGLAARVDLRDGLIEWARIYPRARIGRNLIDALRKRADPPLIAGPAVLFAPRDGGGIFALDRETGGLLWDDPFAPCDGIIGTGGGTIIAWDAYGAAGIDARSGKILWDRPIPDGIRARPRLAGAGLAVATRIGLIQIDAKTGEIVEEIPWAEDGPIRAFALRGEEILAWTDDSAWDVDARGAAPESPRLLAPSGARWRRLLPADPVRVLTLDTGIIAVCAGVAEMFDPETGARRWRTESPFPIRSAGPCGEILLVADLRGENRAAGIDIQTGEFRWQRRFPGRTLDDSRIRPAPFTWDGRDIHVIAAGTGVRDAFAAALAISPADGEILRAHPFPGVGATATRWWIAFDGGRAVSINEAGDLWETTLAGGAARCRPGVLREPNTYFRIADLALSGEWVTIRWPREEDRRKDRSWRLRWGDPEFRVFPEEAEKAAPPAPAPPTTVVHRAPRPVIIDGSLEEWGADPDPFRIAHNDREVLIALRIPDRTVSPSIGSRDSGAGDAIDIAFATREDRARWRLAFDRRGSLSIDPIGERERPIPIRVAARPDPARGEIDYEIALAFGDIDRREEDGDRMGLILSVWDEDPRAGGPVRRLRRGGDIALARDRSREYEPLVIAPDTREVEREALALAARFPALPESHATMLAYARLRDAAAVLDRPDREDGPEISQQVYIDPAAVPEGISICLHDGEAWTQARVWGEWNRSGIRAGRLPAAGAWDELRLPLARMPLEGSPIAGIEFATRGGRALWGRTAIVDGGKEAVVIDGETPPMRPDPSSRQWRSWVVDHRGRTRAVAGRVGAALGCDGISGFVEAPHRPALEPEHLTVEAWVLARSNPRGDRRKWIVNKNTHEETEGHYALMIRDDVAGAYLGFGGPGGRREVWSAPETIALDTWQHLAMTYDGSTLRLFVDGREAGASEIGRPRVRGEKPLAIGRRQDGYTYFRGAIDEVRIYGRALSLDEIRRHVLAPEAIGDDPALAGYWGFDDQAFPADPASEWRWIDDPAGGARRVHAHPASEGSASHAAIRLREPIVAHLAYDRDEAIAAIRDALPRLGESEPAWRFLVQAIRLAPGDVERRIDLLESFLAAFPAHRRAADVLALLRDEYAAAGAADPDARVEAVCENEDLPVATIDRYQRLHGRARRT